MAPHCLCQRPSPLRSSRAPRPQRTCPSSCRDPGGGCTRGTSAAGPRPFPQRPSFWVPLSLLSPSCRCRDPTPRSKGPPPRSCHAPQALTAHGPPHPVPGDLPKSNCRTALATASPARNPSPAQARPKCRVSHEAPRPSLRARLSLALHILLHRLRLQEAQLLSSAVVLGQ